MSDGFVQVTACPVCASNRFCEIDSVARFSRCEDCGLIFDSPRPTLAAISAFYSKLEQYDGWTQNLPAREKLWRRRLRKMRGDFKPGRLLDIGAGIGQFLSEARASFATVDGTEVSTQAIAIAQKTFGVALKQGTIETLALPAASYDTVTATHVLEHVHEPGAFLAECHRLLSPGGRLFIAVPNDMASLGALGRRLRYKLGFARPGAGPCGLPQLNFAGGIDEVHLSHFTVASLRRAIELEGFSLRRLSLDPFWAASGVKGLGHALRYVLCLAFWRLTGLNVYGTIWACAEKV
jgi:SAM-dependent methyltransferase